MLLTRRRHIKPLSTLVDFWTDAGVLLPIPLAHHSLAVQNGKMFVIGGVTTGPANSQKVFETVDGLNYTEVGTDVLPVAISQHTSVVLNDRIYIIGGSTSTTLGVDPHQKVFYTDDEFATVQEAGTDALPYGLSLHASVAFDNKVWALGGNSSDVGDTDRVLYSSNGVDWFEAGAGALLDAIMRHPGVVYNKLMWVFSGYYTFGPRDTCQYSSDGITWTFNANFPGALSDAETVVFNGDVYFIRGNADRYIKSLKSKMLTGGDVTWEDIEYFDSDELKHQFHKCTVFKDKIWLTGGKLNNAYTGKIFYSITSQQVSEVPSSFVATALSGTEIELSWQEVSQLYDDLYNTYIIERAELSDYSDAIQIAEIRVSYGNASPYQDTGLDINKTYYYRIKTQIEGYKDSNWAEESVSTTSTYVLTAEVGIFNTVGQDADLVTDVAENVLTAEAGIFSTNGQDVALVRNYTLSAEAGIFTTSGQDAGLIRDYKITAEPGVFSTVGQDVGLIVETSAYTLTAEAGIFVTSGQDASLEYSGTTFQIAETGDTLYATSDFIDIDNLPPEVESVEISGTMQVGQQITITCKWRRGTAAGDIGSSVLGLYEYNNKNN